MGHFELIEMEFRLPIVFAAIQITLLMRWLSWSQWWEMLGLSLSCDHLGARFGRDNVVATSRQVIVEHFEINLHEFRGFGLSALCVFLIFNRGLRSEYCGFSGCRWIIRICVPPAHDSTSSNAALTFLGASRSLAWTLGSRAYGAMLLNMKDSVWCRGDRRVRLGMLGWCPFICCLGNWRLRRCLLKPHQVSRRQQIGNLLREVTIFFDALQRPFVHLLRQRRPAVSDNEIPFLATGHSACILASSFLQKCALLVTHHSF